MDEQNPLPTGTARMVGSRCLCLSVQRASRIIGRRFDEAFRPLGLNNWQFSLLMALHRPEPPSIGTLAESLATDRTTITANLKPLERRGLLEIRRDEKDARTRRVALTDAGRSLLAEAMERWEVVNASVEKELAPDELTVFRSALGRLGS
jgi:Transcriptional regulators